MNDQKTIQYLMSKVSKKTVAKIDERDTSLMLPVYMKGDSTVYEYNLDSVYNFDDSIKYYKLDSLGLLN